MKKLTSNYAEGSKNFSNPRMGIDFLEYLEEKGFAIPPLYLEYYNKKRQEEMEQLKKITSELISLELSEADFLSRVTIKNRKVGKLIDSITSIQSEEAIRKKYVSDWLNHSETAVIDLLMRMENVLYFTLLLSEDCCPQCLYLFDFYRKKVNPHVSCRIISRKKFIGANFVDPLIAEERMTVSTRLDQERDGQYKIILSQGEVPEHKERQQRTTD